MLDEREDLLALVKNLIEKKGKRAVLIDISIGNGAIVPSLEADVSRDQIAGLAGRTVEEMGALLVKERDKATAIVGEGLRKKVSELHASGELEGILAIGGLTGTIISLAAMKALPFGVPKVLVSSAAAMPSHAKKLAEYFSSRDITVMHTVVDTVGMNHFVRRLAVNAVNAICGMVEDDLCPAHLKGPTIAITEFGLCDQAAHYVRQLLKKDFDVVSFHANGVGDMAVVDLIRGGEFDIFIDIVPSGFGESLLGGNRAALPGRLRAAMDPPIPYIIAPGGFDCISCGPITGKNSNSSLWTSRRLAERQCAVLDNFRVQARTSPEEMREVATAVAGELNQYPNKRMVKFVIPRKGFSSLSVEGGKLYNPSSDEAFMLTLKAHLDPQIDVFEVDADINSPAFAAAVVQALSKALGVESRRQDAAHLVESHTSVNDD